MNILKLKTTLVAALLCAGIQLPASAIPVTNFSFETFNALDPTEFTGWTKFGIPAFIQNQILNEPSLPGLTATDGNRLAYFGSVIAPGGIQQDLTTIIGHTYQILFDLGNGSANIPNNFASDFGGVAGPSGVDMAAFDLQAFSFTAVASATTTTLSFSGQNATSGYGLDNIRVNDLGPASAPEIDSRTAVLPLALLAFSGLLLADQRRRLYS